MKKITLIFAAVFLLSIQLAAQKVAEVTSQPISLTPEDEYYMRPVWSSNGQFLAFTTRNHHGIWVMALATKSINKLVDKEGSGYKFSWSPDGLYILYRARNTENKRTKYSVELVQLHTKEVEVIEEPTKRVGIPQWGYDNSMLFYTVNNKLKTVETGVFTVANLKKPLPSSDKYLTFLKHQKLHLAPLKDSLDKNLHLPPEDVINHKLSPDSRHIIYEEYGSDLTIFDMHTGESISFGKGHRPMWSPNGKWISYMVTEDDGHEYLSSEIVIASADGEIVLEITKTKDLLEMNPAWSPDGNSLVYDEHRSGIIYQIDVNLSKFSEKDN